MSCDCQIRVTSSGKYCCSLNTLLVNDDCIGNVRFSNLPEVLVELEVTPGEWAPATPPVISGTDCIQLFKPGKYRFNFDCETINGTDAPEEGAIGLCYECCRITEWNSILSAQLSAICDKLAAGDEGVAITEIITELQAICAKLLDLINNIGDLSELCDKLEAVLASLETLCDKIEAGFDDMTAILEAVKDCITQSQESLEAICTKLDTLNETLQSVIIECSDACGQSAIRGHCGRPNNLVPYSYGGISGETLEEFTANWEAAGGKTWIANFDGVGGGECHWYCPAVGGDFVIDGEVQETVTASPNPNAEALGCLPKPVLATLGCRDDEILSVLNQMLEKLCQMIDGPCPDCPPAEEAKETVTYTNTDDETEMSLSVGAAGDIKIDAGSGDGSEAAVAACIEAGLAAGLSCNISWTTVDGGSGTATLLPDAETNAFPNFYNQSTNAAGDSGKISTLTCG